MQTALFIIFGLLAVAGALNLLFQRHPINSALSLVVVMMSLAVLYWSLGAEFLAAAQVIVYAGAVMVLFIFVIMLLNAGEEERTNRSRLARGIGPLLIVMLLSMVTTVIHHQFPPDAMVQFGDFGGQTAPIGRLLFRDFLLPFEVVSVVILI